MNIETNKLKQELLDTRLSMEKGEVLINNLIILWDKENSQFRVNQEDILVTLSIIKELLISP
tara:strand:- start:682 stop:867 length:186 start_codon:yes stop_codon:yes gene_type:complete